jgi:hypothetical protein
MNFWKNPEYNALKTIIVVLVVAGAAFFVYSYMHGDVLGGRGAVAKRGVTPPVVTTTGATPTADGAILNAKVESLGGEVSVIEFEYGQLSLYEATVELGTMYTAPNTYKKELKGLSCGSLYHYRAKATNSAGTTYGADMTFTPCPSAVTTNAASGIMKTAVVLNGTVTALGGAPAASVGFDYGTTTGYGMTINAGASTGTFYGFVDKLKCGTLYHYRAKATNASKTSYGADMMFTTTSCSMAEMKTVPKVYASPATQVGQASVILNGYLHDLGGHPGATVAFEYNPHSPVVGYGSTITVAQVWAKGFFTIKIPTGLICGTTYMFRATAANTTGTSKSDYLSFKTKDCGVADITGSIAAGVRTQAATMIRSTTAMLAATVTSVGSGTWSKPVVGFEYREASTYRWEVYEGGKQAQYSPIVYLNKPVRYTFPLNSLKRATTYYYRAFIYDLITGARMYGEEMSFRTTN